MQYSYKAYKTHAARTYSKHVSTSCTFTIRGVSTQH